MLMTAAWGQGPNNTGTYYQAASGKSGQALKTAFFNIIKNHTEIGYDGLYAAYRKTDTRPDGYVRDWFSNATNYRHETDKAGSYKEEGDCYNREHGVPQSWYQGGGNDVLLKCDIVHVLPTDGYVNNRRGNNVLAETKNPSWSSKNGYSRVGKCSVTGYSGTIFEPNDEIKGDIARIYFYMVTCYEGNVSKWGNNATASAVFNGETYQPFKDWYYKMLVEWAQNDPIDDVEIARNNAVYEVQGNRNPFVDYPGLEEYVWGDKKNEPFDYINYNNPAAVRTPTFSPDGGIYAEPQRVTISCPTDGTTIFYTTDGTEPTTSSTQYAEPVTISESLTLKAIAVKGGEKSSVGMAEYVISDDPVTPSDGNLYRKITSTASLESGKKYLVVYEGDEAKALTKLDGKAGTGSVTVNSSDIDMSKSSNEAMMLLFTKIGDNWTVSSLDSGNFMALTSNSNGLNVATSGNDNTARWTISFGSDGNVVIANVQYANRHLQYNASSDMFRCYTGSQQGIALYKEVSSPVTGVGQVNASVGSPDAAYTLQGVKIDPKSSMKRGIFVSKGKKWVIK